MTDLIKRSDALALLDLIAGGEEYIADRERLVAAMPAIDPAAIREAALREAANKFAGLGILRKMWGASEVEAIILAMIGEKK